jgi:capsular polysaccharide transport system permease protein
VTDRDADEMVLGPTSFARSLDIQRRVIAALLMREIITRYGRHNIGFLWLFVEPMMFTVGVTIMWNTLRDTHGSGIPITAFAVTGYSSLLMWRNCIGKSIKAITPNFSLMYHRNVRVIDIFFSRILLEIAGASISFAVLTLAFSAIGWMDLPVNILGVSLGWVLLAWFGTAMGLTMGALSERSEFVVKIWHPISYIMMPVSGVFFMVDWLPPEYRDIVLTLPMVHGVELIREGYFGGLVPAHYDLGYMSVICMFLSFLGLALVREVGRRTEPQ